MRWIKLVSVSFWAHIKIVISFIHSYVFIYVLFILFYRRGLPLQRCDHRRVTSPAVSTMSVVLTASDAALSDSCVQWSCWLRRWDDEHRLSVNMEPKSDSASSSADAAAAAAGWCQYIKHNHRHYHISSNDYNSSLSNTQQICAKYRDFALSHYRVDMEKCYIFSFLKGQPTLKQSSIYWRTF